MTQIPIREHSLDLIGNTPLVRLEGPSAEAGCDIYGKCEFANPGASVKDRAALYIVKESGRDNFHIAETGAAPTLRQGTQLRS